MRKYSLISIVAVVTVLIFGCTAAETQAPAPAAPDLSGVWRLKEGPAYPGTRGSVTTFNTKIDGLLQPWAQELCKKIGCAGGRNPGGRVTTGEVFDESVDPVITKCAPNGLMRSFFTGPFEIIQTSGRVLMMWQTRDAIRRIWTDGRKHPEFPYLWMGHSIGHWEGEIFVVDTIGINEHGWFDNAGHPHSDELHVVERITLTDPNTLQFDFTFEDPKTFTEPFKGRLIFGRTDFELEEDVICEDRIVADRPEDAWPFYLGRDGGFPEVPYEPFLPQTGK